MIPSSDGRFVISDFVNRHGEPARLTIDLHERCGTLDLPDASDEPIRLPDNRTPMTVILGSDEYEWLAECWREALGEDPPPTAWDQLMEQALSRLRKAAPFSRN